MLLGCDDSQIKIEILIRKVFYLAVAARLCLRFAARLRLWFELSKRKKHFLKLGFSILLLLWSPFNIKYTVTFE
jgi:hypothetical protein